MIYLASPFSHPDPDVRRTRYEQVSKIAVDLIKGGRVIFAPITYGFEMSNRFGLCGSWEFWERFDLTILARCDELWVLKLDGWLESRGVQAEIQFAEQKGMPIEYLEARG